METILEANQLNRFLGERPNQVHALRDVSLQIEAGKTYAIVGNSGSGKSTLLYLLGLLDQPDSGSLTLNGHSVGQLSDDARAEQRNRCLGFVFQFHFLLKEFSVLDNVCLPMRKRGQLEPSEMRIKGMDLLEKVDLADKAERLGHHLSGGEQQRVAIARALANDPLLILADEPTGNLDQTNAERVFDLLGGLSHDQGHAFVMVSHNQDLARRCDYVFPMEDGRLV